MAINLSEDAVHALNRAAAAAAREEHAEIAPAHILAGAVSQRDPSLLEALDALALDIDALPERLRDAPEVYGGHLPFTPEAHEVLAAAIESAGPGNATASGHLLLGVARAGDEESRGVLVDWGLKEAPLAAALSPPPAAESDAGPATATAATALLLALALACTADAAPQGSPAGDLFAATPADGPAPRIGPAPADYRPTAAGAPSTDIWVGRLERGDDGGLVVAGLANATDRDGYDNQPSFHPTGASVLYTSAIDSTQTETFRLTLGDGAGAQPSGPDGTPAQASGPDGAADPVHRVGAAERVTRTPGASEFSPSAIPGQDAFSAIREERGAQYLWRYADDGADLGAIFATVEPVGYHAWADERTAVMFVLGDPPTLRVGDALSGEVRTVAENPGRSIHRIPGTSAISFVRKVSEDEWWIERLDPSSGESERLVRTRPGREDYAWTPDGEILMGDGTALHAWTPDVGWSEVAGVGRGDLRAGRPRRHLADRGQRGRIPDRPGEVPMSDRRRELRILAIHCVVGAVALGGLALTGLVVPATVWATVGAILIGAWVGLAVYRIRDDSLI